MNRVKIVTDSTADLPKELILKHNITVTPLKVFFNDGRPLRDGVDIGAEEFYHRLAEKGEMSRTSQPTPAEFARTYKKLSSDGSSIISIHISSAMSGTCQSAGIAKEMTTGADVTVIDSKVTSMGLGLIVLEAARAAGEGKTKGDVLEYINNMINSVQVYFIVDTLEYLKRGGRIGKAQAFWGAILSIKPLLYLRDGLVQPLEKVRGRAKAIDRLAHIVTEKAGKQKIRCSFVHGMDPAGMEQLVQMMAPRLNYDQPILSVAGAVIGTHTGPGVLGLAFIPE